MGTISAYGRDFQVDDSVAPDVAQARINNWMQMHAPDELKTAPATESGKTVAPPPAASQPSDGSFMDHLRTMGRKTGDYWRTVAQGVAPISDEALAGVRSIIPGGPSYDDALADERMRLKRYGDEHGQLAKTMTELGGAAATIPLTMGAGALLEGVTQAPRIAQGLSLASKYSGLDNIAALAAKYPKIAMLLNNPLTRSSAAGSATGAAYGAAAGEGEDERASNAKSGAAIGAVLGPAALGTVKGIQELRNVLGKDNRVAAFLRKQLPMDRPDAFNPLKSPTGEINTTDPRFADMAADDLKAELAKQRGLSQATAPGVRGQDVIAADPLPKTMETILQHPGTDTSNLTRQITKRQFDPTLPPDQQAPASQFGQVGKWFDRIFGKDNFRGEEADILAKRSAEANQNFAPIYQRNTYSPEIEEAYNRAAKLRPDVIAQAKANAAAARGGPRQTVNMNAAGDDVLNYNMEHLHDVKRLLDKPLGPMITFDKKPLMDIKNDLNAAMGRADPDYAAAMKKYGDESDRLDALAAGRNTVFGKDANELDKGIGAEDIKAFLSNPDKSDAEKEMYRLGAARALRNNLLGSDATTFTSNWAGKLNNPNMVEKYKALVDPDRLGSWDMMLGQIRQLSDRYKSMSGALGNSQTARRLLSNENLAPSNLLSEIAGAAANIHAPSVARNWMGRWVDRATQQRDTANRTAKILGGTGMRGNNDAVETIRNLLSGQQSREGAYATAKGRAPFLGPAVTWPAYTRQDEQ